MEGDCEAGEQQCVNYDASGTKYFAIYGRSLIGRYSFGVSLDTDGNVGDNGELPPGKTGDSVLAVREPQPIRASDLR